MTDQEILDFLETKDEKRISEVFAQARKVRAEQQNDLIFSYGFVYFSTYCRNNCNFCFFRRDNGIERYRKDKEEILNIAKCLIESGVDLIDLTMGEDPEFLKNDGKEICDIISVIKNQYNTPVMVSPGVVDERTLKNFADAGADFYAVYQETHNREIFARLRCNQSYDERMNAKLNAKKYGMYIEEGLLAGVGESNEDILDSLRIMGEIGARQARVMSFIPQEGSPMQDSATPDRLKELKIIALMRILYPKALIPASLDVDGIVGLKDRINAGANLITSIIPPKSGLMGVAHSSMDVDEGGRTVEEAGKILSEMGLQLGTVEEYINFLKR